MKRRKNRFILIIFFLSALLILYGVFLFGYSFGQKGRQIPGVSLKGITNTELGKPESVDFSLYWEAWNKLRSKALTEPDQQKMLYGSISGMFSSLDDPYTVFFNPTENARFKQDIEGVFQGIGVEIISKNNLPTVVAPLPDSPAEKAGIKPNDIILEVDGTKTSDISFNETIEKIRGDGGTKVQLKIAREGLNDPITFDITRQTISISSVESEKRSVGGQDIYYIKIRQFSSDTISLIDKAIEEINNTKPAGLVIDLRNDPGGYLETAIDLSSYFLDGGTVVVEKNRDGENKEYKVTKKARLKNYRTAVLVDNGSASSSEIFAGALQDRRAGKIIGEKTFGKGSVQELIEFGDGSAAKITVAQWLTPNGRTINKEGIVPDISVADDENTPADEQLERSYQYILSGN